MIENLGANGMWRVSPSRVLTAAAGVCTVVFGLALIDDRVRDEIGRWFSQGGPSTELVSAGGQAQGFALLLLQVIRDQSIEHAPLAIFTLAATVLLLFMLRT